MKGDPRVCGVIAASSIQELEIDLRKAENAGADLVEIRFDFLEERPNLATLRKLTQLPLIATNRSEVDGGRSRLSPSKRISLLLDAAKAGFEYIDVELATNILPSSVKKAHLFGAKVIVSWHSFKNTPNSVKLQELFTSGLRSDAEITKIVTTATRMEDNLNCLNFVQKNSKRGRIIAFCMGRLGMASRILAPYFGSEFTYASIAPSKQTAPGQVTLNEMRRAQELLGTA
ncbi:MAG: type I 3-dehydroquinate dehydratase [Candidatus Bathyarchaeia archaeon]